LATRYNGFMSEPSESDASQLQVAELRRRLADAEQRLRLIGFEIHDGLAQDLAGAIMFLDAAKKDATYSCPEGLKNVERGMQLVREAMADARRLIAALDAPTAEVTSLTAAVRSLVDRTEADFVLLIDFVEPLVEPRLSSAARATVLRVVREALTNVWRHSQSPRAEVRLREQDGELVVTVRDWGVGFDTLTTEQGHYGLKGIRERATLLGGKASITSTPGQGTTVQFSLPIHDNQTEADDASEKRR